MKVESSESAGMARMSNVGDDPVCEFYTSYPYPPSLKNLDRARDLWQDENVHRAECQPVRPRQPQKRCKPPR